MNNPAGKTAIITGGASGIGFAMAQAFAGAGMKLVIADIDAAALCLAADALQADGAQVLTQHLDVTDRQAWRELGEQAEARFGAIHVLCNNAGVTGYDRIVDTAPEYWDWVIGVNLTGVFNGLHAIGPRILAHGQGGHIVNTASTAGLYPSRNLFIAAYTSSKYGVVGLTESLRKEMAPLGVGVSLLLPGLVKTNIGLNVKKRRPVAPTMENDLASNPTFQQLRKDAPLYGMDPAKVGQRVLKAILADEFYIVTHPEIKPVVEERCRELLDAFRESADPDLPVNPNWMSTS